MSMIDTWLVMDCNYLCHRARYAMNELEYKGQPTEIAYGFLSELLHLQQEFDSLYPIFCWDVGVSIRKEHYPSYKEGRHDLSSNITPEELRESQKSAQRFRRSTRDLRVNILNDMGYDNIFMTPRIESDDWIAQACLTLQTSFPNDRIIIITADQDMYQCLTEKVSMYDPRNRILITTHSFYHKYGIFPNQWAEVKAIAGCSSDNIKGVAGVGEKTAIKYLKNQLKPGTKKHRAIQSHGGVLIKKRNLPLVQLPWRDTPQISPQKALPNEKQWRTEVEKLGMVTLLDIGPYTGKRKYVH